MEHSHEEEIAIVGSDLKIPKVKGILIEVQSIQEKTTLAAAVGEELDPESNVLFTTAPIQNTGAGPRRNERTGIRYSLLPSPKVFKTATLIVVDELTQRSPRPFGGWKGHVENPFTKFLVLTHPENKTIDTWRALFPTKILKRVRIVTE